uniref:Uncharacterized protein n=1 Tax=Tanacetum cinerariifolium TaxID=118510 RepID=A0A6L2LP74_TANCI|nr:hypothetical protein [Tanacetum cinerariifolium]
MNQVPQELVQVVVPGVKIPWGIPLLTLEVLMIEYVRIVKTDMMIHNAKTDMMKLVVEIECVGMSADAFDKESGSSDGLQLEQADLNCVHALNKPHLHEIHVVLCKHEADQHSLCVNPLLV